MKPRMSYHRDYPSQGLSITGLIHINSPYLRFAGPESHVSDPKGPRMRLRRTRRPLRGPAHASQAHLLLHNNVCRIQD